MNQTPAGWYPAPHANNEQRYWDGTKWAEPAPGAAVTTTATAIAVQQPVKKKGLRWWVWVLIIIGALIVLTGVVNAVNGGSSNAKSAVPQETTAAEEPADLEPAVKEPTAEPVPAAPAVPAEFASALVKAATYSEIMHMSKAGIYEQLTSEFGEKFSPEAGQYAVDNLSADYNANALAKAKVYQDSMSMSPEAIRDQLVSEYGEKFTQEEADFAVANLSG
jgi:hypothetical protein